jgi:hypothetical protein
MYDGTYIVYKREKIGGKWTNLFLSCTGRWIKSAAHAASMDRVDAELIARQQLANFRRYIFRA